MTEFTSQPINASQVQTPCNAPAAVRAAAYLRGLDQFNAQAREGALPEIQVQFFRRLRWELDAALRSFQKSSAGWSESIDDFESYTELDWVCNQCEYWMGPADRADFSHIYQKCAEMKGTAAAMTAREYMAVGLLVHTANILVQAMRNPLVLWPHPMRIYRWMSRKSRDIFARMPFSLSRARRRFVIWLRIALLRFS
ncbi:MAG: hypothetical protein ABSG67_06005 [Thermoguttaceae bacterium]|jgi:hypothetical protein